MGTNAPGLKVSCPTRWTVKEECFERILENYDPLVKLWVDCLAERLDTEIRARIIGTQVQMKDFEYYFALNLGARLFAISNNLSKTRQ